MKSIRNIGTFLLVLFTITIAAQSPELVVSANGADYGELEIVGNFLYRGGFEHEITRTDISTDTFTTEVIATGTASEVSLRMAISDDGSEVFLNEFGGKIRSATITSGVATLQNLLDDDLEVLGLDYENNLLYITTTAPQIISLSSDDPEGSAALVYDPTSVLPIFNTHIVNSVLYYSTQNSFNAPITYQVYKLDLTETNSEPELVTTTPERIWSMTSVEGFLYLLSDTNVTVYRTEISNPDSEAPLYLEVPVSNVQEVFSIAHDGDFLYYTAIGGAAGIYRITDDVLSIDKQNKPAIMVSPIPVQNTLTLTGLGENQNLSYSIINMMGQVIRNDIMDFNSNTIEVAQLSSGYYFLEFDNLEVLQFIKN